MNGLPTPVTLGSSASLAVRYRPRCFSEMTGQAVAVRTLARSAREGRVFHTIVVHGPRGTGKTTLARLYAAALNCAVRAQGDACACATCQAILAGQSPDVLEVDAASTRGIRDMERVKEIARTIPEGRYRVTILDEAHALTAEAWQSLLKTLEEPPPAAVFVFATTDETRIPETVLSRALVLSLQRVAVADITTRLQQIAQAEALQLDATASWTSIARLANGGMRDAIQLLEQATVLADGPITTMTIESLRPSAQPVLAAAWVQSWVAARLLNAPADLALLMEQTQRLADRIADVRPFLDTVHEVVMAAILAKCEAVLDVAFGDVVQAAIRDIAASVPAEDLWAWRQMVVEERHTTERSPGLSYGLVALAARATMAVTLPAPVFSDVSPDVVSDVPSDVPADVSGPPPVRESSAPEDFSTFVRREFGVS